MYHFFAEEGQTDGSKIRLYGKDVNHIRNVLRMKVGEKVSVSTQREYDYICSIEKIEKEQVILNIEDIVMEGTELPCRVTLFQGIAKGEKMDWIIQKCVELGVAEIVPVSMKRCVVKLDSKKAEAKVKRWNAIAESAAKQSGRKCIPEVFPIMTMEEALKKGAEYECRFLPYENAKDMSRTRQLFESIQIGDRVGIFIGPEGGFSEEEASQARKMGYEPLTLGKRILRTETAGMAVLAMLMYVLEDREAIAGGTGMGKDTK